MSSDKPALQNTSLTGRLTHPLIWFAITLAAIVGFTTLGPAERSLGANVRVVYLHGAWVWTALVAFSAAGLTGLLGLVMSKPNLKRWSVAFGRTGLFFWITYLPISLWAMETNWNGLYLAEPRFRLALVFSISGLLLQGGLFILDRPDWTSAANLIFVVILMLALQNTSAVMHPPSPILDSGAWRIQIYFFSLVGLTLLAAWHFTRWVHQGDRANGGTPSPREISTS